MSGIYPATRDGVTEAIDLFCAVSSGRVSQDIVDQVRHLIRQGRLRAGDRLPPERDLCERFGVSRVSLRTALRVLEADGLINVRNGSRGGAFIASPSRARLGQGVADLLQVRPLTPGDVTEALMIFEMGIVPLVVERATEKDIVALEQLCDEHRKALMDERCTLGTSAKFHLRLASCTRNATVEMLIQSLGVALLTSLSKGRTEPLMDHCGLRGHLDFVDSIRRRDVAAARAIVRAHAHGATEREVSSRLRHDRVSCSG